MFARFLFVLLLSICLSSAGAQEICDDQVDNDGDQFIDCDDFDCTNDPACRETDCGDSVDNDGDQFTDCDDFDCMNDALCLPESDCGDGIDNDGDNFTDCDDFDCEEALVCTTELNCGDGVDNDGDQFTDCEDFDCMNDALCLPESDCGDGIDNDGDNFTDCDDFDCANDSACLVEICDDGMDNDNDGFMDCDDLDCLFSGSCEQEAAAAAHSADVNIDGVIALSELLRVVQLFNSGGYHCEGLPSEDGFEPGENELQQACTPHDSDFSDPQDWKLSLGETLRLIQFYNVGGYLPCLEEDDGYCPNAT